MTAMPVLTARIQTLFCRSQFNQGDPALAAMPVEELIKIFLVCKILFLLCFGNWAKFS